MGTVGGLSVWCRTCSNAEANSATNTEANSASNTEANSATNMKPTPEPTPAPTPAPTPGHEGDCLFADTQAECEQTTKQGVFCKWCPDFDMCFNPDEDCDSKLKLKFREVSAV